VEATLIAAHLLRVEDSLTLDHPLPGSRTTARSSDDEMPAMLVIPSGRGLTEPHLIVMTDPDRHRLPRPAGWITTDIHLVVCARNRRDRAYHDRPGVLVNRGHGDLIARIARAFGRRIGCDVAVGRRFGGCDLRLRDGRLLAVEGPRIAPAAAGVVSSYAMYGSAVHCWQSAGISVSALEQAAVAVGRYVTESAERSARFLVTGRAEMRLRRPNPMTAAWHAA
jgi:hypothetical protein